MIVEPCPRCGRMPKIQECVSFNGKRRRLIKCPNYCSVLDGKGWYKEFMLIFEGPGDDNAIYKEWNKHLASK